MSPIAVALLVAAAVLVVAAEWTRVTGRLTATRTPSPRLPRRRRSKSKANLQVVRPDSEDFARSVERDLAALPTIDEQDAKRR
jgi:hypothetical protein